MYANLLFGIAHQPIHSLVWPYNNEVLLSTNMELSREKIIQYYRLRFYIEFLIRDAKQHGGLEDCQARGEQKLHYIFMALGSVSGTKLTLQAQP